MMVRRCLELAAIMLVVTSSLCLAADNDADAPLYTEQFKPLLAKYCLDCHRGEKPKGDFSVERLSLNFADKDNRQRWQAVSEQIKDGNMPPKEKPRPEAQQLQGLIEWIGRRVAAAEADRSAAQGRVVLRRLNRAEYQNTVRDLLGVEVELKDLLPIDEVSNGFDNNAEALHV